MEGVRLPFWGFVVDGQPYGRAHETTSGSGDQIVLHGLDRQALDGKRLRERCGAPLPLGVPPLLRWPRLRPQGRRANFGQLRSVLSMGRPSYSGGRTGRRSGPKLAAMRGLRRICQQRGAGPTVASASEQEVEGTMVLARVPIGGKPPAQILKVAHTAFRAVDKRRRLPFTSMGRRAFPLKWTPAQRRPSSSDLSTRERGKSQKFPWPANILHIRGPHNSVGAV